MIGKVDEIGPLESILLIFNPELPEVDRSVAERTMLKLVFLDLSVIHLVSASLAPVIVSARDRLTTDHAGWEVAPA